ncbi:hypothetical protein [Fibrella forsythiae]|uniref:Transposase n=1 Tax=Fibrella forsythiae TaxID=2817061 RepID=A0ABS3JER3_9BACT|nr:hypothetical protein [Fibrella forsythiae]MBO0948480.1 hypothetical protein [Fibrella forsythiae]
MSLYEQLIQEGVLKGIEPGIEQANRKAVIAMLKLKMEASLIATALELPVDKVNIYITQLKNERE